MIYDLFEFLGTALAFLMGGILILTVGVIALVFLWWLILPVIALVLGFALIKWAVNR